VAFEIGSTVGDYEIVALLGAGGMGQVYKVRHSISDRLEAMKVVLPSRQDDSQLAERFEREIKVHASLNHPNIAALHTALWLEGRLLMIIEYVEGVSLANKLRQGPAPVGPGVDWISQVLRALAYAHAHGVIHRDVKPANIMITPAGVVKLTDFGIARAVRDSGITRSGLAVGSLYYMSPEQIKGGAIDGRSDLYSVGVTLYEALTGKRPIEGESDYEIMNAHLAVPPVPPAELIGGFPSGLAQVVLKSLAKKPADRFQTAEEFLMALERAHTAGSGTSMPAIPMAGGVDTATQHRIEKCLAQALGPVAKPLVSRAARRLHDVGELCRELAEQIPDEKERQAFLKCCQTETKETTARATTVFAPAASGTQIAATHDWPPEALDKAKKELARYIGPLARVLVDKTAKRAHTTAELVDTLSQEIPDARDRQAFATTLRRALG
jgi:eukaryotic-like serine/threonine-protein kinase